MYLETMFNDSDIEEIYNDCLCYSVLKYSTLRDSLPSEICAYYDKKCVLALKHLEQRGFNGATVMEEDIETLRARLINYQSIYQLNLQSNKEVVKENAYLIEKLIMSSLEKKQTDLEKISFLYQFMTSYFTYSEDCFNYCLNVPTLSNASFPEEFLFDFKENVPVDNSISGLLVMGQGLCDDIANFMGYFGEKLGLKITKISLRHNDNFHSINKVTFEDKDFLIDATRAIRANSNNSFLVSLEDLNKDDSYITDVPLKTSSYKGDSPNFEKEVGLLIEMINKVRLEVINLNDNNVKHIR